MIQIAELTEQLAQATLPQNQSQLPSDLEVSSRILSAVVAILETNNVTNNVRIIIANEECFHLKPTLAPTLCSQQSQPCA